MSLDYKLNITQKLCCVVCGKCGATVTVTRYSTVPECYNNNHFIIGTSCYQIIHETNVFSFTNFLRKHLENFDGAVLSIIPEKRASFTHPATSYNKLGAPLERRNSTRIVHESVHFYRKYIIFFRRPKGTSPDAASMQIYLTRVLTVFVFHYRVRHLPTTSGTYSFRLLHTSQEWLPGLELGAENSDPQMEKHSHHF
jgi:hypothetical protein